MIQKLIKPIMITAVLSSVVLVIALNVTTGQNTQKLAAGGRLEGAWNVEVNIVNCQSGSVVRTFDSITTFNEGGTVIDSTSGTAQPLKTPGHGVWAHTAGQSYIFKMKSFTFDAARNYTGYTVIQHEVNLDQAGDSYTSEGTLEVYSPSGTLVATGCSATTATRMTL